MAELTKENVWRMSAETDRRFKETDRKFQETDKEFRRLEGIFTSQRGKLVEALVAPSALRLFQERGIRVSETSRRVETIRHGQQMETDILLSNTQEEAVVIEVKSTLKVEDVREFTEELERFTFFFPRFKGMSIYRSGGGNTYRRGFGQVCLPAGVVCLNGQWRGTDHDA